MDNEQREQANLKRNTLEQRPESLSALERLFQTPSHGNRLQEIYEATPPFAFQYRGRKNTLGVKTDG
jgi:hypothetical protein